MIRTVQEMSCPYSNVRSGCYLPLSALLVAFIKRATFVTYACNLKTRKEEDLVLSAFILFSFFDRRRVVHARFMFLKIYDCFPLMNNVLSFVW